MLSIKVQFQNPKHTSKTTSIKQDFLVIQSCQKNPSDTILLLHIFKYNVKVTRFDWSAMYQIFTALFFIYSMDVTLLPIFISYTFYNFKWSLKYIDDIVVEFRFHLLIGQKIQGSQQQQRNFFKHGIKLVWPGVLYISSIKRNQSPIYQEQNTSKDLWKKKYSLILKKLKPFLCKQRK